MREADQRWMGMGEAYLMTMLKAVWVGCGLMANESLKYIRASDTMELKFFRTDERSEKRHLEGGVSN